MDFPSLYACREQSSRERSMERPALRRADDGREVVVISLTGYKVGAEPSPVQWAARIEKALSLLEDQEAASGQACRPGSAGDPDGGGFDNLGESPDF